MVAESNNISLSKDDAMKAIAPIKNLPPHKEVLKSLAWFKQQGFKMVTLTNSSNAAVNAQLKNAGIDSYFSRSLSIEDIKAFKPNLKSYEWALKQMGVAPADAMLVASHPWDIAGAKAAGMQTTFVARPGKAYYPLAKKPDYRAKDLLELSQQLNR